MRPTSTYRLQFGPSFRLADARALVPYLEALGISHVYASPLLGSRRASAHGYDVTDANQIDAELGGPQAFDDFVAALAERGMGLVLDIVPNHMAASVENAWWRDVLQHGPASPYAQHFDIDWEPARPGLANKVMLPILEAHYGRVLEEGKLRLELARDGLVVRYRDWRLPVGPQGHAAVLRHGLDALAERLGADRVAVRELRLLAEAFARYDRGSDRSEMTASRPGGAGRRSSGRAIFDARVRELWELYEREPEARAFLDENLRHWNGAPREPRSFDALDRLLEEQSYRLAYWPVANQEINYRRFFDISELVSLRVDDERVFDDTHALILRLVARGQVQGLRVDHIDGLRDPLAYLRRLRERVMPDCYVVVEKILATDEPLPDDWPVDGTTGYDFLDQVNRLFVDAEGLAALDDLHARASGSPTPFAEVAYAEKRRALVDLFGGELRNLAARLGRLAEAHRHGRDLTLTELGRALVSVTASLPVYRTYMRDLSIPTRDRPYLERAIDDAIRRDPSVAAACEFLRRALLLDIPEHLSEERRRAWLRFVTGWQQVAGAVMAKGVEDTALYVDARLVSLNEVGGDPGAGALSVDAFHERMARRRARWPATLNASSTHDTKRSEDVRARVDVLSQVPEAWAARVARWRERNAAKKRAVRGAPVPDAAMELFLLQTLVGTWPLNEAERAGFADRIAAYAVKAAREAKRETSWLAPDEACEAALVDFVRALAEARAGDPFLDDFVPFQRAVAYHGALGSLAQLLLKVAAPGVTDFYQGTELWDTRDRKSVV